MFFEREDLVGVNSYNPSDIDIQALKARLEYPLSDSDIETYLGKKVEIINYSQLKNYKHIDELLPTDFSYVIILIELEPRVGHWVTLMKYPLIHKNKKKTIIEYFNSYGFKPNYEMKFLDRLLGQKKKYLTKLLNNNDYDVIYNNVPFQSIDDQNSNTCGRHVISRIIAMNKLFKSLPEYIVMMNKLQKKYNLPYDLLISLLI